MRRTKIPALSTGINKETFDNLFDQLNDNIKDTMNSKLRKVELKKWRKLKHQLI